MKNSSFVSPLIPSGKVIKGGVQVFIFCSIAGILLSMWWKRPAGLADIVAETNGFYLLFLLPMVFLDYWLGGWRYRLFLNGKELPFVSQWDCMRSNWANMFMGAATPFQTGGAPAQFYILWRKGVSVTDSLVVSLVNYVATLVFFLLASVIAVLLLPGNLFGANFSTIFRGGFALITGVVSLVLIVILIPQAGSAILRTLIGILPINGEKKKKLLEKIASELHRFHTGFRSIYRHNKSGILLTILATLTMYFNKYLIGYVIMLGLGQFVPLDVFLGVQVIQMLLLYFAPTPGASGLAEVSSVWLMGKLMAEPLLVVYTVIQRLATTILAALIGGMVLIREVRSNEKEPKVFIRVSPDADK
ncbi:MAG: UPF0104 family protein [Haliscomenobacteraceae bacterium CHB4]|nr:hypothetical protein [Saprospiraceae bacterium]MCE7924005.1 UPF0104 family protein [Haliscomenobacteraceae bacterium CHB4]